MSDIIQTIASSSNAGEPEAEYSLIGLDFYSTLNKQSPKQAKLKAAQAELELLDSIIYVETYEGIIYGGDKKVWEYDDDGNRTYYSWYYWSTETNSWKGRQRLDSIFNDNGNLSQIISDKWNSETGQWEPGNKTEWEYNSDGNLVLNANYSWNNDTGEWQWNNKTESTHTYTEDNDHVIVSINYNYNNETEEWTPHHRNEIIYDSNGNRTLYNASLPDTVSNTWAFKAGSFKYENLYDEQGNQTLASYYTWDSEINQWKGRNNLTESSYDVHGNATLVVIKKWDESLNQWINSSKSEYSYNETGLRLQSITSEWDSTDGDWIVVNKTEYSFNENGASTGVIEYEWDNEDGVWVNSWQHEIIYDAYGNLIQLILLQVDTASNELHVSAKEEFTYNGDNKQILMEYSSLNENGQLVVFIKQETAYDANGSVILETNYMLDEQSGEFIKTADSEYIYNESGDKLIEESSSSYYDGIPFVYKTNYYYSIHFVTSVIDLETNSPVVYPNPFNDQLSFQLNKNSKHIAFELFNLQGQKIISKSVLISETISVESLASGVYFYRLSIDNTIHRGKLIKK
ncbi:MAG: T9SS type A sorting domain-containing protein [Prolixibacteraceae bacterium]|nr:T9SS type A sorting domain-containing protein [Prolixibacteraceae bacterium]